MNIAKSQLKQIIKEEVSKVLNEALQDEPGWDFLKPERDPAQAFRDHVADVQGVESKKARSGKEIAADLGYSDKPDPIERAASGDIDMLQAFAEILELTGRDKSEVADELHRLAGVFEEDPGVIDQKGI